MLQLEAQLQNSERQLRQFESALQKSNAVSRNHTSLQFFLAECAKGLYSSNFVGCKDFIALAPTHSLFIHKSFKSKPSSYCSICCASKMLEILDNA